MPSDSKTPGFTTRAVHVGQEADPTTGAVIPPLYATSTYVQFRFGEPGEYVYSRSGNPTRRALEKNLAALEGASQAVAFGSGTAAIDAVTRLLASGDHLVCSEAVYGGTYRLFEQVLRDSSGLSFSYVDTSEIEAVEAVWQHNTRMLYVETPTNPLLQLTDIAAAAELAQRHGALLVVDNTFMSPYFQRPLQFGADVVVHSTTKFLNGHSDSIGGVAATNREELAERLDFLAKSAGATLSPFEAWLIQRGVKTLALRMEQHDSSARRIAAMLADHPAVRKVYYPGLADHPQHQLAERQMSGFGGMLSFELADLEAVSSVLNAVQICALAESLGGVETLISHPASMTHAAIPAEVRQARGISDGLVRLSVGIEDTDDLLGDLERALASV
ncbi:MAG: trans-sulfuration enzyme family protein [Acidobacteriota bacterium]